MSVEQAVVEKIRDGIRRGKPKGTNLNIVEGPPRVSPDDIKIDVSRDANLTEFGKRTLEDRYLLKGETFQGMFARNL